MNDPIIFMKSLSVGQRKRFGCTCCAILLYLFVAFCISPPTLHPISLIGDAVKIQLLMSAGKNKLVVDDVTRGNMSIAAVSNAAHYLQLPSEAAENKLIANATPTHALKVKKKMHSIICRNSNYCEIKGDIRIEANSSTIFVATSNSTASWTIEPYPRKGTTRVKNWTVALARHDHEHNVPKCTQNHTHRAILFSVGGFTGNFFHDFADVLFPLFSTSFQHQGRVEFLTTDHKPWWTTKYNQILRKLSKHTISDIDRETPNVHCYKKIHIGLKFHKELINHPSTPSMHIFRVLLRQAYSLNTETAMIRAKDGDRARPRLMIISRKHTRIITNEGGVSALATKMGFEVVVAETGVSRNLTRFAETVNSCDVLVGVHGAGLTNMVFLPDDAVLVQVVPFGGVDGFARLDFGNPTAGMNIRYLEYKIGVRESSLMQQYSMDHPILRHPKSYRKWDQVSSIYLNKQNMTVNLHRFKGVLAKALKLLRR